MEVTAWLGRGQLGPGCSNSIRTLVAVGRCVVKWRVVVKQSTPITVSALLLLALASCAGSVTEPTATCEFYELGDGGAESSANDSSAPDLRIEITWAFPYLMWWGDGKDNFATAFRARYSNALDTPVVAKIVRVRLTGSLGELDVAVKPSEIEVPAGDELEILHQQPINVTWYPPCKETMRLEVTWEAAGKTIVQAIEAPVDCEW